jgi:hypothetical protein
VPIEQTTSRDSRRRCGVVTILLTGLLLFSSATTIAATDVPVDRQALILTRALAYDRELRVRAGDDLLIAVLAKPGHGASAEMSGAFSKALRDMGHVKVQGLVLRGTQLAFTGAPALAAAVAAQDVDVLYICAGLEPEVPAIIEVTRKHRIVTIGSREEHLARGATLGVFQFESKPTIVVNFPAAKSEGASFSSDLLRLAKVIR